MTSEEKISLRERALRLAIEIRNPYSGKAAMYMWAEHIYKFLSSDGLSLHEAEHMAKVVSLMDSEIPEPEKSRNEPKEIDWSRPQLVASLDNNRCIVEVNDIMNSVVRDGEFSGRLVGGWSPLRMIGVDYTWSKAAFRYHGEIPQEQKTEGLNFLEAMTAIMEGEKVTRVGGFSTLSKRGENSIADQHFNNYSPTLVDMFSTDWQIVK